MFVMWNWDGHVCQNGNPTETKPFLYRVVIIYSASDEYGIRSTMRGAQLLPIGMPTIFLKLTCRHINRRHICLIIKSISVHPLLWMNVMPWFHLVWFSPGCEQHSVSENFKMIMYASAGNRTRDPLLFSVSLLPLGYRERNRHVVRTFTVLFDQTILQELCIVCCVKGFIFG